MIRRRLIECTKRYDSDYKNISVIAMNGKFLEKEAILELSVSNSNILLYYLARNLQKKNAKKYLKISSERRSESMFNKVILIGRLVRDPELRYTPNGKAVSNFTLAVDRGFKDKETGESQADFIRIVTWDKQAELCSNNLAKGRLVAVEGSIRTGSYEKDKQKVYTTDVQATRVVFLDWGDKDIGGEGSNGASITSDPFISKSLEDDDIPF